ncbi:MAG: response regulator [Polyangiaceae bacterium]|jgi:CheY-like chemotaxis protein|nr:response regulator [Polyangiaceae bacterium]
MSQQTTNSDRATILLVDSQPCLRGPLVVQLENAGFCVHVTDSAVEAVEYVSRCRPVLAVVDFDLPCGASGLRLAETLRRLHALPSVFYTFTIHDQSEQAAAAAGALRLLSKELPVEDVAAAIREVCHQIEEAAARAQSGREWSALAKKENLYGIYVAAWQETPEQVKSCLVRFSRTHNLSLDRLADLQVEYQRAIAQVNQEYQAKIAALRPPELLALHRFHERQGRAPGALSLVPNTPALRAVSGQSPP